MDIIDMILNDKNINSKFKDILKEQKSDEYLSVCCYATPLYDLHIDEGIDTGKVIHQFRAKVFLGDSPHTIGNRLIKDMTPVYVKIIKSFNQLSNEKQLKGIDILIYDIHG